MSNEWQLLAGFVVENKGSWSSGNRSQKIQKSAAELIKVLLIRQNNVHLLKSKFDDFFNLFAVYCKEMRGKDHCVDFVKSVIKTLYGIFDLLSIENVCLITQNLALVKDYFLEKLEDDFSYFFIASAFFHLSVFLNFRMRCIEFVENEDLLLAEMKKYSDHKFLKWDSIIGKYGIGIPKGTSGKIFSLLKKGTDSETDLEKVNAFIYFFKGAMLHCFTKVGAEKKDDMGLAKFDTDIDSCLGDHHLSHCGSFLDVHLPLNALTVVQFPFSVRMAKLLRSPLQSDVNQLIIEIIEYLKKARFLCCNLNDLKSVEPNKAKIFFDAFNSFVFLITHLCRYLDEVQKIILGPYGKELFCHFVFSAVCNLEQKERDTVAIDLVEHVSKRRFVSDEQYTFVNQLMAAIFGNRDEYCRTLCRKYPIYPLLIYLIIIERLSVEMNPLARFGEKDGCCYHKRSCAVKMFHFLNFVGDLEHVTALLQAFFNLRELCPSCRDSIFKIPAVSVETSSGLHNFCIDRGVNSDVSSMLKVLCSAIDRKGVDSKVRLYVLKQLCYAMANGLKTSDLKFSSDMALSEKKTYEAVSYLCSFKSDPTLVGMMVLNYISKFDMSRLNFSSVEHDFFVISNSTSCFFDEVRKQHNESAPYFKQHPLAILMFVPINVFLCFYENSVSCSNFEIQKILAVSSFFLIEKLLKEFKDDNNLRKQLYIVMQQLGTACPPLRLVELETTICVAQGGNLPYPISWEDLKVDQLQVLEITRLFQEQQQAAADQKAADQAALLVDQKRQEDQEVADDAAQAAADQAAADQAAADQAAADQAAAAQAAAAQAAAAQQQAAQQQAAQQQEDQAAQRQQAAADQKAADDEAAQRQQAAAKKYAYNSYGFQFMLKFSIYGIVLICLLLSFSYLHLLSVFSTTIVGTVFMSIVGILSLISVCVSCKKWNAEIIKTSDFRVPIIILNMYILIFSIVSILSQLLFCDLFYPIYHIGTCMGVLILFIIIIKLVYEKDPSAFGVEGLTRKVFIWTAIFIFGIVCPLLLPCLFFTLPANHVTENLLLFSFGFLTIVPFFIAGKVLNIIKSSIEFDNGFAPTVVFS